MVISQKQKRVMAKNLVRNIVHISVLLFSNFSIISKSSKELSKIKLRERSFLTPNTLCMHFMSTVCV